MRALVAGAVIAVALASQVAPSFVPRPTPPASSSSQDTVVDFDHELDAYVPARDHYNFYFTYKVVHAWWDAVALGIEDAQRQYLDRGVTVTYEYLAPDQVSAEDQRRRLLEAAASGKYDVIGVDVADAEIITPVIDELVASGVKVMTFSSSDAAEGSRRIAYVGNTHNYEDGAMLCETLLTHLGYHGKVALLVGSRGAPCHEDRARGALDVCANFDDVEVVEVAYDEDSVERAEELTREILEKHPDLDGFICCNMSNPVGCARAVEASGRSVSIVGMDHDKEALRYLADGKILCLGVQDCYSIGFDTLQWAVKIADGMRPKSGLLEEPNERTTLVFSKDGPAMLQMLYGEVH